MNYYITQGTILNIFEYSIIIYKGEKSEKEHIYIYELLCCTTKTNTTLYIMYM